MDKNSAIFYEIMIHENLNWITRFHNHIKRILEEKTDEIPKLEDIDENDKKYWVHVYENTFSERNREVAFLQMFGHLEECLYLLWKKSSEPKVELGKGHSMASKFKPFIKSVLGKALETSDAYRHITEAQTVRNSLIHVAGRISLSDDKDELKRITRRKKRKYYQEKIDRIKILPEGLLALERSIRDLLESIIQSENFKEAVR